MFDFLLEPAPPQVGVIAVGPAGCQLLTQFAPLEGPALSLLACDTAPPTTPHHHPVDTLLLDLALVQPGLGWRGPIPTHDDAPLTSHLNQLKLRIFLADLESDAGALAAPSIARYAHQDGVLSLGLALLPPDSAAPSIRERAHASLEQLQRHLDTLVVIPHTSRLTDGTLAFCVQALASPSGPLHMLPVEFDELHDLLVGQGVAFMGTGWGRTEADDTDAASQAISAPLSELSSLEGARRVFISVMGGLNFALHRLNRVINIIRDSLDPNVNLLFAFVSDESLEEEAVRVAVLAVDFPVM